MPAAFGSRRDKGKRHHTAVRALAFKWIRILHRLWTDRDSYDEQASFDTLPRRGSHLISRIDALIHEATNNLQSA